MHLVFAASLLTDAGNIKTLILTLAIAGVIGALALHFMGGRHRHGWMMVPGVMVIATLASAGGVALFQTFGTKILNFIVG